MEQHTKENPGCYHSMVKYLAQLEKTTPNKEIKFKEIPKFKGSAYSAHNFRLVKDNVIYKYIGIKTIKGGIRIIECVEGDFPLDTKWDELFVITNKDPFKDFNAKPKLAGQYKDCLGGGWSHQVAMYQINDQYFAMMDCAH